MRAKLGQNFLIDVEWQRKIVEAFDPPEEFGEIGPGKGAITTHLLEKFDRPFVVFELDRNLAAIHRQQARYATIEGNFLDWDFRLGGMDVHNFSLIGNLPYESASMMLLRVAERVAQLNTCVFLVQREVAERVTAEPHTRDFSSFTVLLQGQFYWEALHVIPPEAFQPAPEVYSQLIRATPRPESERHPQAVPYKKFLQSSFLHKRKTFRNALKSRFEAAVIDQVIEEFELKPTVRAEEIPADIWPRLFIAFERRTHGQ